MACALFRLQEVQLLLEFMEALFSKIRWFGVAHDSWYPVWKVGGRDGRVAGLYVDVGKREYKKRSHHAVKAAAPGASYRCLVTIN